MKVNQSKKQDKQYQIPMVVTDEVIHDFGFKPEDVTWHRIGNRKCRVVMVDATEEEYRAYMAPIWAEIKREDRDGRCMVKGKNDRLIRCPESNRCEECKHFSEASRERNKPASLSVLMDEGAEPAAEGSFEEDVIYETILEDLIAMLSEIKPKYGRIFRLLYDGATQQEMADELALLASTRQCTKNGSPEKKEGFYQYSAAWDSKHKVTLPEGKTARVLFEMQEMQDGGEPI